eukprot:m.68842 g.68842  ORF g.68842 m.68842 type:complete len:761 (+) comp35559_c0_seq4:75-2357(+)
MYGAGWRPQGSRPGQPGQNAASFPSNAPLYSSSQPTTPSNYSYTTSQAPYMYNPSPGYFPPSQYTSPAYNYPAGSTNSGTGSTATAQNLSQAAQSYAKARQAEPLPPGCLPPTPVTVTYSKQKSAWSYAGPPPGFSGATASQSGGTYYQPRQHLQLQQQQRFYPPYRPPLPSASIPSLSRPPPPPPVKVPAPPPQPLLPPCPPASNESQVKKAPMSSSSLTGMDKWPASLRNYVARAFGACQTEKDKDETEVQLRKLLSGDNSLLTKDWDNTPLPLTTRKRKSRWATPPPETKRGAGSNSLHAFVPQQLGGRGRSASTAAAAGVGSINRGGFLSRGRGRGRGQRARGRGRGRGMANAALQKVWNQDSGSDSSSSSSSHHPSTSRSPARRRQRDGRRSRSRSRTSSRSRSRSYSRSRSSSRSPSPPVKFKRKLKKQQRKKPITKAAKKIKKKVAMVMVKDEKQLSERAKRFGDQLNSAPVKAGFVNTIHQENNKCNEDSGIDWSRFAIKGTCLKLEKQYLRLTSAPDPSLVRPVPVLKKALEMVRGKWKEKQNYRWTCEQMKSIRQDLTVQCIRDVFTVEVYESHARIALEKGDREEFNQCLTQLRALYAETGVGHVIEFTAYWILYLLLTKNTTDMNVALSSLSRKMKEEPPVKHSLHLRSAWALSNYHKFFRLYRTAPNMGTSLIDMFVQRERLTALRVFAKTCRPTIPVSYLKSELGFDSVDECRSFLQQNGGIRHAGNDDVLDCKLTYSNLVAISQP